MTLKRHQSSRGTSVSITRDSFSVTCFTPRSCSFYGAREDVLIVNQGVNEKDRFLNQFFQLDVPTCCLPAEMKNHQPYRLRIPAFDNYSILSHASNTFNLKVKFFRRSRYTQWFAQKSYAFNFNNSSNSDPLKGGDRRNIKNKTPRKSQHPRKEKMRCTPL